MGNRREKTDVLQGTLALMVLKTLDVLGPLHGYGIVGLRRGHSWRFKRSYVFETFWWTW